MSTMHNTHGLTVGITTRNRPQAVERCLRSIACLSAFTPRVIVFDDASETPVEARLSAIAGSEIDLTVIRDGRAVGNIVGRNRIMHEAATPYVLLLDDDAIVLSADAVARAIQLLDDDSGVAAIAFAQAEADGRPWPERMQPGRATITAYVAAFIGFAHLLRRQTFLAHGGYRESLVFYGEEKDLCVRLLDVGLRIVYLPDALVGHVPDSSGRSATRYVRYVIRNDCLYSLYNEPWPLAAVSLPVRLWRYRRMSADHTERGGFVWILHELTHALPDVWRSRRAVSWSTIREWRRLARTIVPYRQPARSS